MSRSSNFSQKDIKYWVALSCFPKFGPKRFKQLIDYFPNLEQAYSAHLNELKNAGISPAIAEEFILWRQTINPDDEFEKLAREKVDITTINDENYPRLLKEIYDAPALLYYRGKLDKRSSFCLAVVGSRKFTSYGQRAVEYLIAQLAQTGLTIVSGLALGIDALAHNTTLNARGLTMAVLGSGVDRQSIYPATNRQLAERIIESGGAVISEFPLGTPPLKHHFPQRNRIIAGLSLGTLVIEAVEKSGALITAQLSLEYNREVFAVPGSIFNANSAGTNKLIRDGAKLTAKVDDILEALELKNINATVEAQTVIPANDTEEKILNVLNHEPMHINSIFRAVKLDTGTINGTLLTMELKGYVRNLGGGNYILS